MNTPQTHNSLCPGVIRGFTAAELSSPGEATNTEFSDGAAAEVELQDFYLFMNITEERPVTLNPKP